MKGIKYLKNVKLDVHFLHMSSTTSNVLLTTHGGYLNVLPYTSNEAHSYLKL